jgi:hypothetical protein
MRPVGWKQLLRSSETAVVLPQIVQQPMGTLA